MRAGRAMAVMIAASLAGCGPADEAGSAEAQNASDSFEAVVAESASTLPAFEALNGSSPTMLPASVEAAVATAAARAPALFFPAGCAQARASGNVLTLTVDACSSGTGLGRTQGPLTGTLEYNYTFRPGAGLLVAVRSTDLRGPRVLFRDLQADMTVAWRLGRLRADVTSRARSTVIATGVNLQRTGAYSLVWESATRCFTLDGRWNLLGNVTLAVTRYARCGARCPEPGGQVTYTAGPTTIVLDFLGGSTARWQSGAATGTVMQRCEE